MARGRPGPIPLVWTCGSHNTTRSLSRAQFRRPCSASAFTDRLNSDVPSTFQVFCLFVFYYHNLQPWKLALTGTAMRLSQHPSLGAPFASVTRAFFPVQSHWQVGFTPRLKFGYRITVVSWSQVSQLSIHTIGFVTPSSLLCRHITSASSSRSHSCRIHLIVSEPLILSACLVTSARLVVFVPSSRSPPSQSRIKLTFVLALDRVTHVNGGRSCT